jgi:hypothetical protein
MKAKRKSATTPIGLGFRAGRGGSIVVGVAMDDGEPRLVLSTFLVTAMAEDRLTLEPYHVAAEMVHQTHDKAKAASLVTEGRKRQDKLASKGMNNIIQKLKKEECEVAIAALLVNRAGWIIDALEHSLSAPEHPPVAEGLAVRDALRFAFNRCGIEAVEMDEKSLQPIASKTLRLSVADIDLRLKKLGALAGKPWRKEQKAACLSAWLALAARS